MAAIGSERDLATSEASPSAEERLKTLSAEIGRRRRTGLPCEDLIARHRELSAQAKAAAERETPQRLVIQRFTDMESDELRETWSGLLTASKAFSPSMSWEWAYAWYTHFGKRKPVDVRVVRESPSGRPVGLLSLMEVPPRDVLLRHEGYLPCRQLAPIGTRMGAEIDYTHPLIDAQSECGKVVRLLLEELAQTGRPFVANHWDSGEESARRFITEAADLGFTALTVPRAIAYDSLPDSFEELIEQVPKTMIRRKLRRYQREGLLQDGVFTLETHGSAEEITSQFPIIQRFSEAKYGFASIWRLPWFVDFVRSCVERCSPSGWPVLWVLRDSKQPVAVVLGWIYKEACFITAVTHHAELRRQEPGHVLLARVLQQLIDRGVKWIDIHTAEGYKTHYFRGRRTRYDPLILCPPGRSPNVALAGMFLVRGVRQNARTVALKVLSSRNRHGRRTGEADLG